MIEIISQNWKIIVLVTGAIASFVAFGDKFLSLLIKFRDIRNNGNLKPKRELEVSFLKSFLEVIDDDLSLNSPYREILARHINAITKEVRALRASGNWEKILQIRMRIREYFEYSGQYEKAIEFGSAYEEALRNSDNIGEAYWVQVKDIGYMQILAENCKSGRGQIKSVLEKIDLAPNLDNLGELRFYAHRYIGISFLRSRNADVIEAKRSFELARKALDEVPDERRLELLARIEGNFGNLYLHQGDIDKALSHFRKSLCIFERTDDIEHLGIVNLQISEALNNGSLEGVESYLDRALQLFSRIGWLEGIARTHFEKARYLRRRIMVSDKNQDAAALLNEMYYEAKLAFDTFHSIRSSKWIGRVEQFLEDISSIEKRMQNKETIG